MTMMMDGTISTGEGPIQVAPVSFLIARGMYAEDHRVAGPDGTRPGVGDRWPGRTTDMGMAVTIERHGREVKAFLSFRADRLSDQEWAGFAAMPNPITVLATPPLAWFLVEYHGGHSRAPIPLTRDRIDEEAIGALLADPADLAHEVLFFGIAGDEIRCVKVGIALDQVWRTLAEAAAATRARLDDRKLLSVLRRHAPVAPAIMFAEAMRRHLLPRPR